MSVTGKLFQIQNYSVNDGDGIRTTVFLAGCPLRCRWCANPEGQDTANFMVVEMTVEEVMRQILRQEIFYRFSGGGVTLSGGEATAQPEFLRALTDALYDEGISVNLETCGYFDFQELRPSLLRMDRIFMDLKHTNSVLHKKYTGMDNTLILENIRKTAALPVPLVIRIPVINGFNGDTSFMDSAFRFLKDNAPEAQLELLPFHTLGEEKYRKLGRPYEIGEFAVPTEEELERYYDLAARYGIEKNSFR